MIIKTDIEEFLLLAAQYPILDVRSPSEYGHAHIPGAVSFPLFTDDERKVVGTAYKQQSRETAIKIGLDYFGIKMRKMVEEAEQLIQKNKEQKASANCVLVHCWRGGMRSAGIAWLLDLYGFKVYTLKGGYKAFRQWTLRQFSMPYTFNILGGYTGSGKTLVLHELAKQGQKTIDLEGLANHKGSAFGGIGITELPSQEMFENKLALALTTAVSQPDCPDAFWVEDESRRIGNVNIPEAIWDRMRNSRVYFLDIPSDVRLDYIVQDYGKFKNEELVATIMRIRKRLGGLATKQAINYLLENNVKECFGILLAYYDKYYIKGLNERERLDELLTTISSSSVDPLLNSKELLSLCPA